VAGSSQGLFKGKEKKRPTKSFSIPEFTGAWKLVFTVMTTSAE